MPADRRRSTSSRGSAARSRTARGRGSRGAKGGGQSPAIPLVITGASAVVIAVIFALTIGGGGGGEADPAPALRDAAPAEAPTPGSPIRGTAKAGKTPDEPAPEVTPELLGELDMLLKEAKGHFNDYQRKHLSDDQTGDMEHAAQAKACLDQMYELMAEALVWEEKATMGDWAMPPAYQDLLRRYQSYSTLDKKIRMTGL